MTRTISLAAAGLVLATGLTGCGKDDDTPSAHSDSPTPLTEKAFLKQGNALCAQFAKQQKNDPALQQVDTEKEFVDWVEAVAIPDIEANLDDLRALTPPSDLATGYETVLADSDAVVDRLKVDPKLALDEELFADTDRQFVKIGLTRCGS